MWGSRGCGFSCRSLGCWLLAECDQWALLSVCSQAGPSGVWWTLKSSPRLSHQAVPVTCEIWPPQGHRQNAKTDGRGRENRREKKEWVRKTEWEGEDRKKVWVGKEREREGENRKMKKQYVQPCSGFIAMFGSDGRACGSSGTEGCSRNTGWAEIRQEDKKR